MILSENKLIISGGQDFPLIFSGTGKHQLNIVFELDSNYNNLQIIAEVKEFKTEKLISEKTKKIIIDNNKTVIDLFFDSYGFYVYNVRLRDINTGEILAQQSSNISIVPRRTKIGPMDFGTCTHFGHGHGHIPYSLDLIKLAGFSSIRDEIFWSAIEKPIGTFKFDPKYDKYVDAAVERGISILMILDYGNPAPGEKTAYQGFPIDESGQNRFVRYTKELVSRYKDKIFLWELWNEPIPEKGIKADGVYFDLLRKTYKAVKEIQPQGEFICSGGAPNHVDGAFINPIFKRGGGEFMDGYAMHTYVAPYNPEDGYLTEKHPFLKNVSVNSLWPLYAEMSRLQSANHKKPINAWITEMGWHLTESFKNENDETIRIDELRQAAYSVRLYLLSRRYAGTRAVYLYDFQDDGVDPNEREHNFGIIRKDYSPKAAFSGVSVLTHLLENKEFINAIKETPDTKVFCYGDNKEELIAFWNVNHYLDNLEPEIKEVEIDTKGKKQVRFIDWQGKISILKSKNGVYRVPISQNPSYITYLK